MKNIQLLKRLLTVRGVSGDESAVAALISDEMRPLCDDMHLDTRGNLIAHIHGSHEGKILLSAHMDEVGFMICEVDGHGLLHFSCVGGIDSAVLCGKRVRVGKNGVSGIISSLPYHLLPKDKRLKAPKDDDLYIDIGADSYEDAVQSVSLGDFATFDSEFCLMGDKVKGNALDDRAGAFILIEAARRIRETGMLPVCDIYLAFTVREEIGYSGAEAAAREVRPDMAIIIETTAIGDVLGAPEHKLVAREGAGGVVSPLDRGTVYPKRLVDFAMDTARACGINAQLKQYVSGGNDAARIQKTNGGVPVMALSVPTRYLHSPACVMDTRDIEAMISHTVAMLTSQKIKEIIK